jgi:imidazolonepropionase
MRADRLWMNARIATMAADQPGLGAIEKAAIACKSGVICWIGPMSEVPGALTAAATDDCAGRWITPGLINCHTHLIYSGQQAHAFEMSLSGADDGEIARAGHGPWSIVEATRAATIGQLVFQATRRLDVLIADGVTTVESKSGFGFDLWTEQKQLEAARLLPSRRDITLVATYLAAMVEPPGASGDVAAQTDRVCKEMIPRLAAAGLADSVDVVMGDRTFSAGQTARIFDAAVAAGLPVMLHADQLSHSHGADLAAQYRALSAAHLDYADENGAAALARAGTVAVLLPATSYFNRAQQMPPVKHLRAAGTRLAIAADGSPSAPLLSPLLAMNMAAVLFRLTVEECLLGVTRHAAAALGRAAHIGTLETGKACDLAIWDIERPADLVHRIGPSPLHARIWQGLG